MEQNGGSCAGEGTGGTRRGDTPLPAPTGRGAGPRRGARVGPARPGAGRPGPARPGPARRGLARRGGSRPRGGGAAAAVDPRLAAPAAAGPAAGGRGHWHGGRGGERPCWVGGAASSSPGRLQACVTAGPGSASPRAKGRREGGFSGGSRRRLPAERPLPPPAAAVEFSSKHPGEEDSPRRQSRCLCGSRAPAAALALGLLHPRFSQPCFIFQPGSAFR